MNYLELINSFWQAEDRRGAQFSPAATRLYFALLNYSNRQGWPQVVFKANGAFFPMATNTLKRARQELAEAGLIQYSAGTGRGNATAYKINVSKIDTFSERGQEKGAKIDTFTQEKGSEKVSNFDTQTKQINRSPVDKSVRQEKPLNFDTFTGDPAERENPGKEKETPAGAAPAASPGNGAILSDNAPGGGIPQATGENAPVPIFGKNNSSQGAGPTLAQVEAEQRAKGYQLEAARFYSHFAPDWKTANGEPVRSWRKLYAWCEVNGLFDTAPTQEQGQRLPAGTIYTSRMPGDPPQRDLEPKRWDPGEPQSNWL